MLDIRALESVQTLETRLRASSEEPKFTPDTYPRHAHAACEMSSEVRRVTLLVRQCALRATCSIPCTHQDLRAAKRDSLRK